MLECWNVGKKLGIGLYLIKLRPIPLKTHHSIIPDEPK